MNGELHQLSRLVLYVKDMTRSGRVVDFKLDGHEKLSFIPKKDILFSKVEECSDAQSWYKLLEKREIKDISLVSYFEKDDIKFAGLSNSTEQGIVTEYANGKTTIWIAKSKFDDEIKVWTTYYKEFKWRAGDAPYTYEECRRDFEKTLLDIEELAYVLECDNFAKIFREAYDILTSKDESSIPEWARDAMPNLTSERLRLFLAASKADVFGAMGSWNDSPMWVASEKGLQEKYYNLSHDLYVSTRKAVMNAVNG